MKLFKILLVLIFINVYNAYAQKDIFELARYGSVDEVKALMNINADTINVSNGRGYLPLTLACYNGNVDVAEFLASKVKNIDGLSSFGTPLMAAAYKNQIQIVKVLLKHKANTNYADANGTTALHYAVINRSAIVVEELLKAGADKKLKDNRGKTALDYAELTEEKEIIELLKKNTL